MTRRYPDWDEVIDNSDPHRRHQTFLDEQLLCVRKRSSYLTYNERMEVTWVNTSFHASNFAAYHSIIYYLN